MHLLRAKSIVEIVKSILGFIFAWILDNWELLLLYKIAIEDDVLGSKYFYVSCKEAAYMLLLLTKNWHNNDNSPFRFT